MPSTEPEIQADSSRTPSSIAYILTALIPLALFTALLKADRGIHSGVVGPLWEQIDYVKNDLLLFLLVGCALCFVEWRVAHQRIRRAARVAFYLFCIVVATIEVSTFVVYVQTGFILDWPLLKFSLERSEILGQALQSQTRPELVALFVGTVKFENLRF